MAKARHNKENLSALIMNPQLIILVSVFALLLLGFVMVYSTSSVIALAQSESPETVNPMTDAIKQVVFAVIGCGIAFFIWKKGYALLRSNAVWVFYVIVLALLLITCAIGVGDEDWGARRWLAFGPVSIQPAEFAKIAIVLSSARLFVAWREHEYSTRDILMGFGLSCILPIAIIIGPQSDLGTTMICIVGILAVWWIGELRIDAMIMVVACVVVVGLIAMLGTEYRRERFMVFLNPWNDGEGGYGAGYQLIHSVYALASGGFLGAGLGNSHEKYLYLTQSDTDFIFAIVGEELGFVGAALVVVLFVAFLIAGMQIARSAPDYFSAMVAGGLTLMIVFQAFLNIAMVSGIFPTVGKPLPFVSSGGSALIASLMMVGIILCISEGSNEPTIYDRRRANLRVVRAERSVESGESRHYRRVDARSLARKVRR